MFRTEGPGRVYRGLGTALVTAGAARACSFGLAKYYKSSHWMPDVLPDAVKHLLSSVLATCTQPLLICPLENVKTILQVRPPGYETLNVPQIVTKLYRERGVGGFYSGVLRGVQRNIFYFPIFQSTRQYVDQILPQAKTEKQRVFQNFFAGSMGSLVAGFATYPLQVARIQAQAAGKSTSTAATLTRLMREGGVQRLYCGFLPQFVMGLVTGGLFNATEKWVGRTLAALAANKPQAPVSEAPAAPAKKR
eukprot:gnl/Trimastix_PCT/1872.p2 GENE.gnl/Trimastix_PCT/1872~~gnl/Trimastix_PCT/1872.p2  ORF type:complete len:249 (+),score=90.28 gnl/Trimastix_PCT/1872:203-949(+)